MSASAISTRFWSQDMQRFSSVNPSLLVPDQICTAVSTGSIILPEKLAVIHNQYIPHLSQKPNVHHNVCKTPTTVASCKMLLLHMDELLVSAHLIKLEVILMELQLTLSMCTCVLSAHGVK